MFSQKTLNFLFEVRMNDSKQWFDSHRDEYEAVLLNPFKELVTEVGGSLKELDPEFVTEPKITRTISRIHRDTRFSKDKSKYRDSMWFSIKRDKKLYPDYPGFYFEIRPSGVWWGGGMYFADSAVSDSHKTMVLSGDPLFLEMERAYKKQKVFALDGDDVYKRTKHPDQPEEKRLWLDRKSLYFSCGGDDPSAAFGAGLARRLSEDFKLLYPMYRYLTEVQHRKILPEQVRAWNG